MNHIETITAFVKPAPATAKELSTLIGLSESRTSELCRELVKSGKLAAVKSGKSLQYRLPNGETVLSPIPVSEAAADLAEAKAEVSPEFAVPLTGEQQAAASELLSLAKTDPKRAKKIVKAVDAAKAVKPAVKKEKAESPAKVVAKLHKRTLSDDLLDTTPAKKKKPAPKKAASEGTRIRSCNGSQARLDSLKAHVKENGGWTMAWAGAGRTWEFKCRGKEKKALTSLELAKHTKETLAKWVNKA